MVDAFSDLPDALVRDLLNQAVPIGDLVRARMERLRSSRDQVRNTAKSQKLIYRTSRPSLLMTSKEDVDRVLYHRYRHATGVFH
jgi:hypothetical protein